MLRLSIPSIGREEERAMGKVLKTGFLVQGRTVADFEGMIADYLKVPFAVAVNSGTSALHLALLSLDIGPGDEVIVPDYTFPATANVVELTGAKPVIVDIEFQTYNMDPAGVEAAITSKTRAIMPAHLFGQSADMDPILRIARKHRIPVVEDAACVFGAHYKGKNCGTLGEIGCYSFHPRKILTTGEGGVVITRQRKIAERLRILRNHGIVYKDGKADFVEAGYNYRMTEFQAAMGKVQLKKLDGLIRLRRKVAEQYTRHLQDIHWLETPETLNANTHIFQAYIIRVKRAQDRDPLIAYLRKNGIEANIGTYALHNLTFYKNKYRLSGRNYPVSNNAFETLVSLPLFETLTSRQILAVVKRIKQFR